MTLDDAPTGMPVAVLASRTPTLAVTRRLAELGVRPGAQLRIQARTSGGGAILAIGDDRLAVSRAILRAVTVEVVDAAPVGSTHV